MVVGRVRSPAGLAESDLPVLDALAGDRTRVPDLIAAAIARITTEQYREFLTILLPFPFEPAAPWEQLGPNRRSDGRGERASRAAFDLSWDACNRPGQLLDGRSRRDWAEQFLAESILAGVSGHDELPLTVPPAGGTSAAMTASSGADTPEPASGTVESASAGGRARRTLVLASVFLVVLALGTVAAVVLRNDGAPQARPSTSSSADGASTQVEGESTLATTPISCASVGSLNTVASADSNASQITQHLIDLYSTLPASAGCPPEPAFIWGELAVQELDSGEDGLPAAMLVERTGGTSVYLSPTAYARYRTLGSGDGSLAQGLGGLPGEVTTFPDGHQEVALSKGVLFVAEQQGAPFFWVPADFLQLYRDTPELGRPVANPLPSLVQDYQFGFGEFDRADSQMHLTYLTDPGAELPAIETLANTVMRQADGTAWWIGPDGKRYWIATGGVWNCLVKGRDEQVQTVRAYAIASLPYGGHAQCPKG